MEDGRREEGGVTVICLLETNFVLFEINCFIIFLFQNLIFRSNSLCLCLVFGRMTERGKGLAGAGPSGSSQTQSVFPTWTWRKGKAEIYL